MTPIATVIVPTTAERWELTECSLGCILAQDVNDLEVFIIGDGVGERSRERYLARAADDPRVRFFDYPKNARRGEPYRHEVLMDEARGRVILYCTDRDLWFPHHASTLIEALDKWDFANTQPMNVARDGSIELIRAFDMRDPRRRKAFVNAVAPRGGMPISTVGHTLDAYRRLPVGWSETPKSDATDTYMWQKVLRNENIRATTLSRPTVLYFARDAHPGWPVPRRLEELCRWLPKVESPEGYVECLEAWSAALHDERIRLFDENERLIRQRQPLRALLAVGLRHVQRVDLRFGGRAAATWRRLRTRSRSTR